MVEEEERVVDVDTSVLLCCDREPPKQCSLSVSAAAEEGIGVYAVRIRAASMATPNDCSLCVTVSVLVLRVRRRVLHRLQDPPPAAPPPRVLELALLMPC